MLSCTAPAYRAWSLCILVLDLTYSAFLLPITIGMQVGGCRPRAPAKHGLSGERGSTAQMGRLVHRTGRSTVACRHDAGMP